MMRDLSPDYWSPIISSSPPPPSAQTLSLRVGDVVGPYTVVQPIGRGGTALVFRGTDKLLGKDVAIKQVLPQSHQNPRDAQEAARREIEQHRTAAQNDPDRLVQFIEAIEDPRGTLLVSEYVDGQTLQQLLDAHPKPQPAREAMGILAGIAKALESLHQAGMLHRDLKPANVMIPNAGGLKLADFGLASMTGEALTMDAGTTQYMAPELLKDMPGLPQSDLYSLGIIGYQLLAGRDGFEQEFRSILGRPEKAGLLWSKWHTNMDRHANPVTQYNPDCPPELADLIGRLMQKNATQRPQSASAFLEALRRVLTGAVSGEPAGAGPSVTAAPSAMAVDKTPTAALPKRSKLPFILAGTLGLWLVAGVIVLGILQDKGEKSREARINQATVALAEADDLMSRLQYSPAETTYRKVATYEGDELPEAMRAEARAGLLLAEAWIAFEAGDVLEAEDKAIAYEAAPEADREKAKTLLNRVKGPAVTLRVIQRIESLIETGGDSSLTEADALLAESLQTDIERDEDEARLRELGLELEVARERALALVRIAEANELAKADRLTEAVAVLKSGLDNTPHPTEAEQNEFKRLSGRLSLAVAKETAELKEREVLDAGPNGRALALSEAASAWRAYARLAPQDEDAQAKATEYEAEQLLAEGQQFEEEGRLVQAAEKFQQSLDLLVTDAAEAALERVSGATKRQAMLNEAETLLNQGELEQALAMFQKAGGADEKTQEIAGRIAKQAGLAAMEKGDLDEAQQQLETAASALPADPSINSALQRVATRQAYQRLINSGDQKMTRGQHGSAKVDYLEAQKLLDTPEVAEKIIDSEYQHWLGEGQRAIAAERWDVARASLRAARRQRDTPELQKLMEKVDAALNTP